MTTYVQDEQSVHTSAPSELYEFTIGATVYRYTTREVSVVYSANTYTPVPHMKRNAIEVATQDEPPELMIQMPTSNAFVQAYAFTPPPKKIVCTLRRLQSVSGLALRIWEGRVGGITVKGRVAMVRVPSILDDGLNTEIPNRRFQATCNHVLFDTRCGLNQDDFDFATTVVSAVGKTVVVTSVNGQVSPYYKDGRIKRSTDSEWRQITAQSGTTLLIDAPFRTLTAADAIVLYPGCDKQVKSGCRDKFNNVLNFGGHPSIPRLNPYTVSLAQNPVF